MLEKRSFPPSCLRLEVSEDVVMADPERTLEVLAGLREIGVATALDDFGAGHVSLGHLKQLGVDEIKIDRSFVMRLVARRARRRDRAHHRRPRPAARDARGRRGRRDAGGVGHCSPG